MARSMKTNLTHKERAKLQQVKQESQFENHIINQQCKHIYYRVIKGKYVNGRTAFECSNCGELF